MTLDGMTVRDSPAVAAFRDEARTWLEGRRPRGHLPPSYTSEGFELRRAWERELFEAGWAAVHWPAEHGGRGASLRESAVFSEEYQRSGAPERINGLGLNLFGPALLVYGTPAQRQRWLAPILRCDDIWCQGFSEPEAGSDLASLRTRAELDGEQWVVNGQKIWTSLGLFGDWIFALARTNRDAPKHRGISMLAIDLRSDGVEVRPLRQIDGAPAFAEVFFTDVRVPVDQVVGPVDEGWRVAMHALGHERGSSFGAHVGFSRDVEHLAALVGDSLPDPVLHDRLAGSFVRAEVFRWLSMSMSTRAELGVGAESEPSVSKLYWSRLEHRIFEVGLDALDAHAELEPGSPLLQRRLGRAGSDAWSDWHHRYWYARAAEIFAGTTEIQLNIIAERLLGLPREGGG